MKTHIWLILFLLANLQLSAQQQIRLNGFVYDADSKEMLIGAVVQDSSSGRGTVTNEQGYYSLAFNSAKNLTIKVSYIGYKSLIIRNINNSSSNYPIALHAGVELGEVKVSASKTGNISRSTETSTTRLPMKDVKMLPNLFGEVDIIKAYQLTPGVQSGGEGKSEMYVRGGSPDQNLVMLDDVPLYYVSHFGGFFSVFNADAINDVKLIKGGFPARYGGRLSSVMDVRMKDGSMHKFSGSGSIGLLSAKMMVEGPLVKEKSAMMVSARKNLFSPFILTGTEMKYGFYDLNAKLNYRLSQNDRVFLSFYAGNDHVKVEQASKTQAANTTLRWGNVAFALRYNRVFSGRLFGNLTFARTLYKYNNSFSNELISDTVKQNIDSKLFTSINDIMFKSDFSWQITEKYQLRFGHALVSHTIRPNDEEFTNKINDEFIERSYHFQHTALEGSLYVENEITTKYFGANVGIRLTNFSIAGTHYPFIEPRLSANIPLTSSSSVKASFSLTNQFLHLLSYSGTGMPADYWMPSTENVAPSAALQYTIGFAKSILDERFQLTIEAYYKQLDGLIAFKPGTSLIGNLSSWENVVVKDGKGINRGIEVFLQKTEGRSTGWAGITVAKADRTFSSLNQGKTFPFKYDRLLDISLVWNFRLNSKVNISATWKYGSGYPVTLATERYETADGEVFVYDDINSFRMRDYHRLDCAVAFPKQNRWGTREWSVSIFNLYNRKNPFYYFYEYDMPDASPVSGTNSDQSILRLKQMTLFGFFPSVSYNFKF